MLKLGVGYSSTDNQINIKVVYPDNYFTNINFDSYD